MPDYRDETSFEPDNHTMDEIAEAIRHKKYGAYVREAIAEGFELIYGYDQRVRQALEELADVKQLAHTNADAITDLQKAVNDEQKSINRLREDFQSYAKDTSERLDRIEEAVFGNNTVEITSPIKPDNDDVPMIEINTNRKDKE